MTAPRVVLDTNVVLSALLFGKGQLARLRVGWQRAAFVTLVSTATTEELVRALTYPKFGLDADDRKELLSDYLPYCATVRMPATPPKTPACRDPFDVPFLQLAIVGKADHLVTGDRDLLRLRATFRCPIVTASEFLSSLDRI